MSSHREAPEISKDPVADNTDIYAFVSPANDTVTIIANYIPLEDPAGGPNFYEFGDDVLYEIHIDNNGDGKRRHHLPVPVHRRRRATRRRSSTTPARSPRIDSPNWNRQQTYTVDPGRASGTARRRWLSEDLPCPPCNIGPRSTPNYAALAGAAVTRSARRRQGVRRPAPRGFYVDLGSIFDLGDAAAVPEPAPDPDAPQRPGVDALQDAQRAHHRASRCRSRDADARRHDADRPDGARSVHRRVGRGQPQGAVSATARRPTATAGPCVQVSRLGNPLFNEVIVPMARRRTAGTRADPSDDSAVRQVRRAARAGRSCCRCCTRACSRTSAAYTSRPGRPAGDPADRHPVGHRPRLPELHGPDQADMLRLNVAIPPSANPNRLGLVGGDPPASPTGGASPTTS